MKRRLAVVVVMLACMVATPALARHRHHSIKHARPAAAAVESPGLFSGGLVARAEAYKGSNPTGWGRVWCGRFMAMIAPTAAAKVRNPNMARDWATLPHISPRVGAIAVLRRGKGGHVGVVTGFDEAGNPTIISGNHNRVVGEGTYPRSRVIAYVDGG